MQARKLPQRSLLKALLLGGLLFSLMGCLTTRTTQTLPTVSPQNLSDHYCLADPPIRHSQKACLNLGDNAVLYERCMAMVEGIKQHNATFDTVTGRGKKCR